MTKFTLPPRPRTAGFLLALVFACSDGSHSPVTTSPAPPPAAPPPAAAPEPRPEVAHSAAPAPAPESGGEGSQEPGTAESGELSAQPGATRVATANAARPAPSAGSGAEPPTENPGGGSGEEEEEGEKKGEGEGEEEETEPRQSVPCDRVGTASVSARALTWNSIRVSWGFSTEPECEQSATIEVSRPGHTLSFAAGATSTTDTPLEGSTEYCYTAVATTADGEFQSGAACATTPDPDPDRPLRLAVATLPAGHAERSSALDLSWEGVEAADSYQAQRKQGSGPYGTVFGIGDGTSHRDKNLTAGTEYCYRIRTVVGDAESDWTAEQCATPPPPPPPPPTGFGVATLPESHSDHHSALDLTWTGASGADSYQARRKKDSGNFGTEFGIGNGTSHRDTGLDDGARYCYQIRTVDGSLTSDWTGQQCETVPRPCEPTRPRNLDATASSTSDSIALEWDAPQSTGCGTLRYRIDRREGSSGDFETLVESQSGTTYTDSGLQCGETYYYRVYMIGDGTVSGTYDSDSATVRACGPTCTAPDTPSTPTASVSDDDVTVSWGSVSVPAGCTSVRYRLSRDGTHVTTTTGTTYTDRNRSAGEYCYRVAAESLPGSNLSSESDAKCVEVLPDTPTGLDVEKDSDSGHSQLDVSWNRVSGADRYELRRKQDGGSYGNPFSVGTDTSYGDTRLAADTEYCYQVRTVDNGVESAWSDRQCATTDPTPTTPPGTCPAPAAPAISTSLSGRAVTVSWPAVPVPANCTSVSYNVYRDNSEIDTTTSVSYTDPGRPAGTHCYEVTAESGPNGSESRRSGSSCRTVPVIPPPNFAAAAASSSSVNLTWTAASHADSYEVRYRESGGSWEDWEDVGSVTSHPVTGLEADTEYEFALRTVEGAETSTAVSATAETPPPGSNGPPAPTNLRAGGVSRSEVQLRWSPVSGADRYEVRYRETGGTWSDWANGFGTTYLVQNLDADTPYEFEVRAVRGGARSAAVSAPGRTFGTLDRPDPTATATSVSAVTVSWGSSTGASWYLVRRKLGVSGSWGAPEFSASLAQSFTGLSLATEYCFGVQATSTEAQSEWSEDVCATTWGAAPENLRATGISGESVDLAWDASEGATGYRVTRTGTGTAVSGTAHTVGSLARGATVAFTAAALFDGVSSSESGELTVTTADPQAPTGAPAATPGDGGVTLSWAAGSGAGSWSGPGGGGEQELAYAVERRTPPDSGAWEEIASGVSATEYEDDTVTMGANYQYRVFTTTATLGDPVKSPAGAPATVMAQGLAAPENVVVTVVSAVALQVTWDAVSGADGYEVQWRPLGGSWSDPAEDAGAATVFDHIGVAPDTEFEYQVRARTGAAWARPVRPGARRLRRRPRCWRCRKT